MEIIIKKTEDGQVTIKESGDWKENDVVNAYAVALAIKSGTMFKNKEVALKLIKEAYEYSERTLDEVYEIKEKEAEAQKGV